MARDSAPERLDTLFSNFFTVKQKKMNLEMMLLADCVTIFNGNGVSKEEKRNLLSFIKSLGEVVEVRAVAYHDIASKASPQTPNLYRAWFKAKNQGVVGQEDSAIWKSKFLDFIEDYCRARLQELSLKENPFFDQAQFAEVMQLIESYYKLDGKVHMIQHHKL